MSERRGRVKCRCGMYPRLEKRCGDTSSTFQGVEHRIECPKCGPKDAPWRKSYLVAISDWETKYYNRLRHKA